MGEGDLPVDEIMRSLRSVNYEGFLSLEWVKRWLPELSDAGVVIPQFIHYMSRYTEQAALERQVAGQPRGHRQIRLGKGHAH